MKSAPSTFLHAHASDADWREALGECLRQLETAMALRTARYGEAAPYTLGWCYITDYYAPHAEAIVAELRERLPAVAWVGTVGVGVSASGIEYFDEPALVLMLAPLPRASFRLFSGLRPLPGRSSGFTPHTALVHTEGSTPDVQELIEELAGRTSTGYLFGGLASARNRSLHIADEVFSGGISGVAFGPEVELISRVTQGCQPVGPVREVTRAERNFVISLDGKPALDCAMEDLGIEAGASDDELSLALAQTLVGLHVEGEDQPARPGQFGTDTVVRHLVGADRQYQVLAVAEHVAPGMRMAFCTRHAEAARADLVRIATEIRDEVESGGRRMDGAVYVSCSGRGGPHFGAPSAELQIVRHALGDVPLVGFFAGGEIARHHLYGYTGVLTVFTAAA